ncbi:hypothetical protein D3C76_1281160 [compost metagenome]
MDARFIGQLLHSRHVTVGEIHHMNVVANAGAVRGRVVVAEHRQRITTAYCHLGNVRHQVIGDTLRIFAHIP